MAKLSRAEKRKIKIIVSLSALFTLVVALFITNFFVPVIYLTTYIHFRKDLNSVGQMRVRYIDVGYGDCSLIEFPDGKTMLIDGGTGTYGNVYKILNYLNKSKIKTIDYLVCTSVKSEHCGALKEIARYKDIGTAYIPYVANLYITEEYASFYKQLLKSGARVEISEYGKGVYNDEYGYFFGILSPSATTNPDSEYDKMNTEPTVQNISNASIVLWLEYAGGGFMFLSDAGAEVQQKIARRLISEENEILIDGKNVKLSSCAVLKAANHCANGYTEPFLYDIIEPEASIISVGKNAQACPSNAEIANLQLYVQNIYRTDVHGTITVTVNTKGRKISKEK